MVVKKILKQLTSKRIKKEINSINKFKITEKLQKWIREYKKFGERNEFTWKLFLQAKKEVDYMLIPEKYCDSIEEIYFLIAMFVILIDDVVDKNPNRKLLNELLKIPAMENCIKIDKLNKKDREYLKFTLKAWHRINYLIKKYPRYNNFKNLFTYDIKQLINSMEYDYLVSNDHNLINKTEFWLYAPHTMQFIVMSSVDLMCCSLFSRIELSAIREITWHALRMMRIGNWVSTWKREINDNDFSSGVFACAISQKTITVGELSNKNYYKIINKIKKSKAENKLLKEWEGEYKKILAFNNKIKTINIKKFLSSLERLLFFELLSKKYK